VFAYSEVNVTKKILSTLTVLPMGAPPLTGGAHIPSLVVAASLPLPFWNCHETYIH
jgi:hypothetical protein